MYLLEALKKWSHDTNKKELPPLLATDGTTPRRAWWNENPRASAGVYFPYLYDATQEVAPPRGGLHSRLLFVWCRFKITVSGRFDGARPGNDTPITVVI